MIELKDIEKNYKRGAEIVHALRGVDLRLQRGEFVSIVGPSGSGKTTLMHILGLLDKPSAGRVLVDGIETSGMCESELVRIRRGKIGFVFQQFYLIPGLDVLGNVTLPLVFDRKRIETEKAEKIIERVGLSSRIHHKPNQLSGGEMQRTAIARALINDPELLLADEPTGNLDTENSENIFSLLRTLHSKGLSVVMVTHNPELAARADRTIKLRDGKISSSLT